MKKKISVILILTMILTAINSINAKADSLFERYRDAVQAIVDNVKTDGSNTLDDYKRAIEIIWRGVGYIVNPSLLGEDIANIIQYIKDNGLFGCDQNSSDQEVIDAYLVNCKDSVLISDSNITIADSFNSINKSLIDKYKSDTGYDYVYSENFDTFYGKYADGTAFQKIKEFIQSNQDSYIIVRSNYYNPIGGWLYIKVPLSSNGIVKTGNVDVNNMIGGQFYNYTNWNVYDMRNSNNVYQYDSTNQAVVQTSTWNNYWGSTPGSAFGAFPNNTYWQNAGWFAITSGGSRAYKMFNTLADLKGESQGVQPYYISQDIYNTWDNSTGDYTMNSSNTNNITYGDVTSYVNNYYGQEGTYPNTQDINVYIENNIPPTPPPDPGGSGGEGGGTGGGGSGSGTGIFDFLSDLGSVLGNLISNLGQALTNIIRGISELVTTLTSELPTVFFEFIGAIFGWMPEEWVTLLSLSLACMLIFGIVRIFRG